MSLIQSTNNIMKHYFLISLSFILLQVTGSAQIQQITLKVSDDIELIQLSDNAYIHISISEIEGFGNVSSNGILLIKGGEAFLFDTPVTNEQTETLTKYIQNSLHAKISTFVPNHWHSDCMGGLNYLHKNKVKSYANQMTIDISKKEGKPVVPLHSFTDSLSLNLKGIEIKCYFLGGGHSVDNIVVWVPSEKLLFPGCMVKDMPSTSLGNLADAAVNEWPGTIEKVINKFPDAKTVVPGHGSLGGKELLNHTRDLLLIHTTKNTVQTGSDE